MGLASVGKKPANNLIGSNRAFAGVLASHFDAALVAYLNRKLSIGTVLSLDFGDSVGF